MWSCEACFFLAISCSPARLAVGSFSPPRLPASTMMRIWDFFTNLARAGKGYLELKEIVESVKALKKTAIITKAKNGQNTEDQRKLKAKTVRTPALIASVTATVSPQGIGP